MEYKWIDSLTLSILISYFYFKYFMEIKTYTNILLHQAFCQSYLSLNYQFYIIKT